MAALFLVLFWLAGPALATVIKATPDRDPVRMDESFSLVFSSEGSVDDEPDFTPLRKDFEILGQNQGSQVTIINGKFSKQQQWSLTLMPKHAGSITIPSIAFGKDQSPSSSITVLDAGASPSTGADEDADIKLEVQAEPKDPYVQAQTILTVRVLLRVNLLDANLSEPAPADALVEKLGDDHRYSTTRSGRQYTVIERKYALFPQKSGLLRIDPLRLDAQVEVGGRSFFSRSTRAVRVRSEAIDLKVRSIPPEFTGKHWLPATDLQLEESWTQDPPRPKIGEPLTRTLTLKAQGATVGVLPELGADAGVDASIKQYPDQPSLDEEKNPIKGVSSSRREKTAFIPSRAGEFKLPEIAIPWWNTRTERMEIARIPARALHVDGAGEAAPTQPSPQQALPVPQAGAQAAGPTRVAEDPWFWLALTAGLGWLVTALAWWRISRAKPLAEAVDKSGQEKAIAIRQARKFLQQACASHDAVGAQKALIEWARLNWPDRYPNSLKEIAMLGGQPLAEAIGTLSRMLYGKGEKDWQGDELWAAVKNLNASADASPKKGSQLEPLYR